MGSLKGVRSKSSITTQCWECMYDARLSEATCLGCEADTTFEHSDHDAVGRMLTARRGSKICTLYFIPF